MRRSIISTTVLCIFATAVTVVACGEENEQFDRNEMLGDVADNTISANNDALLDAASSLREDAENFCSDPTEDNLEALRTTWLEVKKPLKRIEAFSFGPYRYPSIGMAMNADKWPGRGENIEEILAGDDEIDADYIDGLDYRDRTVGYPAIGYLIYGAPDGADTTLAAYTSEDHAPQRRCDYLQGAAEHADGIVGEFHAEWNSDGDGYIDEFADTGNDSDAFPSTQDAITDLMGTMMFALDQIALMKLAEPAGLGEEGDGQPIPENVEAPYSETSVEHALWTLEGVEVLYLGEGDGLGMTDYVQFRESEGGVDQTVRDRLQAAREALEAIPKPLSEAVVDSPEAVEEAIDKVDELNRALNGEVSTLLGINPTTVEGDND